MNYWFILNIALFMVSVILYIRDPSLAVLVAVSGLVFILFNWNMHAIFSKIRSLNSRNDRIKIAAHARKIMPFHLMIGNIGLIFIILHVLLIIQQYGITYVTYKAASGGIAFAGLIGVLFSGYLRRKKATGKRRRAHLQLSMLLFFMMALHVIW
ncbi:hypothetical protein [Virgibacillus ihumii]|uniref:hypothetical protein n=1 Tax=Virgibacillus ihumii TaxID=2686091 RepID=UPI00157E0423|nr:hypothetical protein [Virgibacillus ihumii]